MQNDDCYIMNSVMRTCYYLRNYGVRVVCGCLLCISILTSCHTTKTVSDDWNGISMRDLACAAIALGFDVEETDDWPLLIEASQWIGVKYVYGGNTKKGIDCSGLTSQIFKKVYNISLHRTARDQYMSDCRQVKRDKLQMGDLVFFATGKSRTTVSHVGIYLKNNQFIHASSSRGVVVSDLTSNYYVSNWVSGGRVRVKQ